MCQEEKEECVAFTISDEAGCYFYANTGAEILPDSSECHYVKDSTK